MNVVIKSSFWFPFVANGVNLSLTLTLPLFISLSHSQVTHSLSISPSHFHTHSHIYLTHSSHIHSFNLSPYFWLAIYHIGLPTLRLGGKKIKDLGGDPHRDPHPVLFHLVCHCKREYISITQHDICGLQDVCIKNDKWLKPGGIPRYPRCVSVELSLCHGRLLVLSVIF